MKKITFLVAAIFLAGSIANAATVIRYSNENRFPVNVTEAEPIMFTERGIEFYIFPDGQFDFNTQPSNGEIYYRNGRRNANVNTTYGASSNINKGIRIERDNLGRIRRVGNVFVNYDANDRIKRIGSVYMTYNRFALTQVGGLQIIYNRRGQIVDMVGMVKGNDYNNSYYYGNSNGYNNSNYNDDNTSSNANSNNDNDYYYYRTNGTKAKIEDDKKVEKK